MIRYAAGAVTGKAAAFATTLLIVMTIASSAAACRCKRVADWPWEPIDVAEAVKRSDFVFYGKLVSQYGQRTSPLRGEIGWNFEVTAVWKGPISKTARIHGQSHAGLATTCDLEFEIGKIYVVFATQDKTTGSPHFQANRCSLTSEVQINSAYAKEVIGRLGDPLPMPRN